MKLHVRRISTITKCLVLITIILLYTVYITHYYKSAYVYLDKRIDRFEPVSTTKYVLYWSPFWKFNEYQIGQGYEPFKNCKYNNCVATANRNLVPLKQFDALIFHASTYNKKTHGVPVIRFRHQKYILMNLEAPVYITPNLKSYNSYFNWTMSYRYDSDIVRRHGYFFKEETNYTIPNKSVLTGKNRLAAWFVSNCQTSSLREVLNKEIQRFMDVDVYGNCGTLQCARKKDDPKLSDPECYHMLEERYKFYFSFENSYCKDYSTEKLYNILLKNIVPVVYGGSNYSISAPPHSVINVEQFSSVESLVRYLKYLDQNDEEYLKYFEWKKHYKLTRSLEPCACQLCQKLHEDKDETIYHNIKDWWWGTGSGVCQVGKSLPKIVSNLIQS